MFLAEPINSIVDFPFYRQVVQKSLGRAVGYVAYLGFLFSIAGTLAIYLRLGPVIHDSLDWAASSIPALTFADGKVSSAAAVPTLVRYPKIPNISIMIDTARTTPVAMEEMSQHGIMAYLTQNTLFMLANPGKLESYDLTKSPSPKPIVVNADFYRMLQRTLPLVLYPVAWLTAWGGFVVWKLLAALFYSLLGLALNAALSGGLSYDSLYKIAMYAQTPVVLLQLILVFVPRQIPGFFLIALLIVGTYTWQAIRQNRPSPQAQ